MQATSPSLALTPANYGRRAFAFVIDASVTLGAAIAVYAMGFEPRGFLSRGDGFLLFIPLNWALIGGAYSTMLHGSGRGQTLGKMIAGIRVSDANTGANIGLGRALGRWLATTVLWCFPLIPVVGGLLDAVWCLFDSRRQAIHDKVARSLVCHAEPAQLPRITTVIGRDAAGRALSVRLATVAAFVGLIFALAAEGLDPVWRTLLFLGVALACVDAVTGRSLRAASANDRLPLLARLREELVVDVVSEIGRPDRVGLTDLRTRILSAAADGRLALYALLTGVLALYGSSVLLSAERVDALRLALALLALSFLAPLPGSMTSVAIQLRARATAAAALACVGSIVVLALSAYLVSLPTFVVGLGLAAIAARTTRSALPPHHIAQPAPAVVAPGVDA